MKKLLLTGLFSLSLLLLTASPLQSQTNRNRPKPKTSATREIGQPQSGQSEPAKTGSKPDASSATQSSSSDIKQVSSKRKKVMVTDFDARGLPHWWGNWDVGSLFANVMVSQLSRTEVYDVVERSRMMDVLQEQNMTQDERFRQDKVTKVGQLLGADYILFGYLTNFSRKKSGRLVLVSEYSAVVSFSVRLVDIRSGSVVKSAEIDYVSDKNRKVVMNGDDKFNPNDPDFLQSLFGKAINESIAQAVEKLTGEKQAPAAAASVQPSKATQPSGNTFVPTPAPASDGKLHGAIAAVDGDTVIINRGQSHGIKVGDIFEVTRGGITDPETGKLLRPKVIAEIRITRVEDDSSDGAIISRKDKVAPKDPVVLKAGTKP